ncbi:hypothetical protein ACFYZ8_33255 [Streptomyces sp. NPDC001668]|uniref:hypothetical protein n=1 Tax=Streptomyces sp. NPDC001668 TaxID=3364598 RepID=UPI0036B9DE97
MSLQRTFTAASEGAVCLGLASPIGEILVTVDTAATRAEVVVSAGAPDSPSADVVRGAKAAGEVNDRYAAMAVIVPDGPGIVTDTDTVAVHATLPPDSSLVLDTQFANLRVEGDLHMLSFNSGAGSIVAEGVNVLTGSTVDGNVTVARVHQVVDVETGDGDVTVDAYGGRSLDVETVTGAVDLTATAQASGSARVATIASVARVRGAFNVDLQGRSVSGSVLAM